MLGVRVFVSFEEAEARSEEAAGIPCAPRGERAREAYTILEEKQGIKDGTSPLS